MIINDLLPLFIHIRFLDIIDILLVAIILYGIYNLIKGTAAFNIFLGVFSIFVIWQIVKAFEMRLLSSILQQLISVGVIALIVIFQPEIRQFLLLLGNPKFIKNNKKFNWLLKWISESEEESTLSPEAIEEITQACQHMSDTHTGALIVIPKKSKLIGITETGDLMDAKVNNRIIESTFFKNAPLHDGAMIIADNRIQAARCVLPISKSTDLPARMGLRHRASVGITEQSDAIAISVSEETGRTLESVKIEDCGRADKVWADKENSRIIGGKGAKIKIASRIAQVKKAIEISTSDFDKEKLQERLAKLSGGVAVINVGAATEVEMKDKKERVNDAVAATKAALEEGIVPGGAVALLDISGRMTVKDLENSKASRDEVFGFEIVKKALESPFVKLMENAGVDAGQLIAKAREVSAAGQGFNIMTLDSIETAKPVDMLKEGIIDPLKVVRAAVQNAISVAIMILTTEALITDLPEKKESGMPGGMPPGGMGGMDY